MCVYIRIKAIESIAHSIVYVSAAQLNSKNVHAFWKFCVLECIAVTAVDMGSVKDEKREIMYLGQHPMPKHLYHAEKQQITKFLQQYFIYNTFNI